jgi:dTDP-4-dehydrorhamnose reductase
MKVLVFGASGMIGNAMFRILSEAVGWQVWGTLRSAAALRFFSPELAERLVVGINAESRDALVPVFGLLRPDVVINCIGLTKHHREADDRSLAIPLNSLLPHRLANLCAAFGTRLIHVSTDCVFSGRKGGYREDDTPDAADVYGKSKHLGEVDYPNAVTLRTSTIGQELQTRYGLLEWFLAQETSCKGFARAVFSGLPNVEFARVVRDVVIPRPELRGLFHVGGEAIDKYHLLREIAAIYGKRIDIQRDESFIIDRSLDSGRLRQITGYAPAPWPELISAMYATRITG